LKGIQPGPPGWVLGVGLTTLPCKKIVGKPPKNSAGFCRGDQGLNWAVELPIFMVTFYYSFNNKLVQHFAT
jgi:hypothetical protein